jgi:CRISPR system Cascade subunit CasE
MPYLSRVSLNPLRTQTQRMLRNPHILHAAVLGGLSRQPVVERVLWRLETTNPRRADLLVLTESRPSWEHLVEQAGWPSADDPQALVKSYEPLLDAVRRGRNFAFRLKANPASSTKRPLAASPAQAQRLTADRPRGIRVAHRKLADQIGWLITRMTNNGMTVLHDNTADTAVAALRVTDRTRLEFRKGDAKTAPQVVLECATFDGLLRVEDASMATQALLAGIGPGKAYGFGLLTLAPPQALGNGG